MLRGYISQLVAAVLAFALHIGVAMAQGAPIALSDFSDICLRDADHEATWRAFSAKGWTEAQGELTQLFAQDYVSPDDLLPFESAFIS